MPKLKQISCSLEIGSSNTPLQEYGARYRDGHVEIFVPVPDTDVPFTIHVTTEGYIAPGLALFVWVDGEYQCNRNRIGLKMPGEGVPPSKYEVEFRMRQKEDKTSAGGFVVRDWTFAKLNRVGADKAPNLNPNFTSNVGTIEIVALRCYDALVDSPPPRLLGGAKKGETPKTNQKTQKATPAKRAASEKSVELGGLFGLFDGTEDGSPVARRERDTTLSPRRDDRSLIEQQAKTFNAAVNTSFIIGSTEDEENDYIHEWANRGRDDMRGDKYLGLQGDDKRVYKTHIRGTGHPVSETTIAPALEKVAHKFYDPKFGAHSDDDPPYLQRLQAALDGRGRYDKSIEGLKLWEADIALWVKYVDKWLETPSLTDQEGTERRLVEYTKSIYEAYEADKKVILGSQTKAQQQDITMGNDGNQSPGNAQGPWPLNNLPDLDMLEKTLQETLLDIEVLRQVTVDLQQQDPQHDVAFILKDLKARQIGALENPILNRPFNSHDLDDMTAQLKHVSNRQLVLKNYYRSIQGDFPGFTSDLIEQRLQLTGKTHDSMSKRVHELQMQAKGTPYQAAPAQDNQDAQGGGDGPFAEAANGGYGGGGGYYRQQQGMPQPPYIPGFQQVGQGIWNGGQQMQPAGHGYAGGAGGYGGGGKVYPVGHPYAGQPYGGAQAPGMGQNQGGWQQRQSPAFGDNQRNVGVIGWGASPNYQQKAGGDGWNQSPAAQGFYGDDGQRQRTPSHGFSDQNKQNGVGWAGGSAKKNDGGWGNNAIAANRNNNNNNGGNGWAGYDNNNNGGGGNGWSKDDKQSKQNGAGWGNGSQQDNGGNDDGNWGNNSAQKSNSGGGGWNNSVQKSNTGGGGWGAGPQNDQRKSSSRGGRQANNVTAEPLIKPYWKDWKTAGKKDTPDSSLKKRDEPREVYTYPASPLPAVPEGKAKDASHGIQTSRGADYDHLTRKPTYIDTFEQPYAVFSFKYRTKEKLEQILNTKVDGGALKEIKVQAEKDKLMNMPKHKLIEELMAKRTPSKAAPASAAISRGQKAGSGWVGHGSGNGNGGSANGWGGQGGGNGGSNKAWGNEGGGNVGSNNRWCNGNGGNGDSNKPRGGSGNGASGGNRTQNGGYNWGALGGAAGVASGKSKNDNAGNDWGGNSKDKGKGDEADWGWDGQDEAARAAMDVEPGYQGFVPGQVMQQGYMPVQAAHEGLVQGPAQQGFMHDQLARPPYGLGGAEGHRVADAGLHNADRLANAYAQWNANPGATVNQSPAKVGSNGANAMPDAFAQINGDQQPLGKYHPAAMAAENQQKEIDGVPASPGDLIESKSTNLPKGIWDTSSYQPPGARGREKEMAVDGGTGKDDGDGTLAFWG